MGKNEKRLNQLEVEVGDFNHKIKTAISTLVIINQKRKDLAEEVKRLEKELEEMKNVARIQGNRISVLEEASAVQIIRE